MYVLRHRGTVLYSTWLMFNNIYLKYTVSSRLRKYFYQQVIHFSVSTGKTVQQIFSGNTKTWKADELNGLGSSIFIPETFFVQFL